MHVVEIDVGSRALQEQSPVRGVHASVGADGQDGLGQLGRQADHQHQEDGEGARHAADHGVASGPRATVTLSWACATMWPARAVRTASRLAPVSSVTYPSLAYSL